MPPNALNSWRRLIAAGCPPAILPASKVSITPPFVAGGSAGTGAKSSPGFVQVEIPEATPPVELVIELGATARLRLTSEAQIPLAARLLHACNVSRPC